MRDLKSNISPAVAVAPAVLAATDTSAAIDLLVFDSAVLVLSTGAVAGAGDFTAKLQHSPTTTGGDFVDVSAADLDGALPALLEASTLYRQGYKGKRRYLRTVLTKNGGTSIAAAAIIERGHPTNAPVA